MIKKITLVLTLFLLIPTEAKLSQVFPESKTLQEVIDTTQVIVIATPNSSRTFTFNSELYISSTKDIDLKYDVTASSYTVDEIIWSNMELVESHSLEVKDQIKSLLPGQTIYVFDPNALQNAHEQARYDSGGGSKSYSQPYYENRFKKDPGDVPRYLFLQTMDYKDKTWVLTEGGAMEPLEAKEQIDKIINRR